MSDIVQTVTLKLVPDEPGEINITFEYTLPETVRTFGVTFAGSVSEIQASGFQIHDRNCKWTEGNTREPSIRVRFGVNDGSARTGYGYVDTGTWAITRLPRYAWQYSSVGGEPEMVEQFEVAGEGVVSGDGAVAYLGPYTSHTHTARATGETFRLVVPRAASLTDDPDEVLSALGRASDRIDIGALNETVVAIAAPTDSVTWAVKGRQSGDDGFWVRDDAVTTEANEAWVHEYVHTRQLFDRSSPTRWFIEGTADYFASVAAFERGDIGRDTLYRFLTSSEDAGSVLADPDTWTSSTTAYRQGRRACVALDAHVRDLTSGSKTLEDVVERLNERSPGADGSLELSNRDIATSVREVAGTDPRGWFEAHVHGSQAPTLPEDTTVFPETSPTPAPTPSPEPEPEPEPQPEPEPDPVHVCPICDTETTDRLCPTCGHEFENHPPERNPEAGPTDRRRCPICDTWTTDRLCPTCGHDLATAPAGGTGPEPAGQPQCPICDTLTGDKLCPTCGHDMAPRCPVCDTVGGPDDTDCPTCGESLRG